MSDRSGSPHPSTRSASSDELDVFERLLTERLGRQSQTSQRSRVSEVLMARMQATRSVTPQSYLVLLSDPQRSQAEWRTLAAELTIGESYFFRSPEHWNVFFEQVLPALLLKCEFSRCLRFASIGCSGGEEPYTLAILLRERRLDLAGWNIDILGIDVNPRAIERAQKGIYTEWSLRNLSADYKERYFRQKGNTYALCDEVRSMVHFQEHNVLHSNASLFSSQSLHVLFCRNVFIYFTPDAMRKVVDHFAQALIPGGFLFLGPAETLRGISRGFHLRSHADTFYYQTPQIGESVAPDPLFALEQQFLAQGDARFTPNPCLAAMEFPLPSPLPDDGPVRPFLPLPPSSAENPLAPLFEPAKASSQSAPVRPSGPAPADESLETLLLFAANQTHGGLLADAEAACRRLMHRDEFNAGAYYLYALCRERIGAFSEAAEHLHTACYLDPAFALPPLRLGALARRAGHLDIAHRHFRQALILLERDDHERLVLLGGGFSRAELLQIARSELAATRGNR